MTADRKLPILLCGLLAAAAVLNIGAAVLQAQSHVITAFLAPAPFSLQDVLVRQVLLPRSLVALCAGAGLALAAYVLQPVLRNPLASPTTFGLTGGATFAVTLAALVLPIAPRFAVALFGAGLAGSLSIGLTARRRLTPFALTVAGLFVALLFGAGTMCLFLLQGRTLGAQAIWGAGSLEGTGWPALSSLVAATAAGTVLIPFLARPLTLLGMDADVARALGVPPTVIRLFALALAIWFSAVSTATVGGVAFVDLAAVACVRYFQARSARALWCALTGAAMLWFTDGLAQVLSIALGVLIPTGSIAGLLGAPIMIAAARRVPTARPDPAATIRLPARWSRHIGLIVAVTVLVLILAVVASLGFGRAVHGWHWSTGGEYDKLLALRLPRVAAAAAAGALLATAGAIVQRLTANPMASPEILGIGATAALVNVLILSVWPETSHLILLAASAIACGTLLFALLWFGQRRFFDPSAFLLIGIGLSAILGTAINLTLAIAVPDSGRILSWLGGSTYGLLGGEAATACVFALGGLLAIPFIARWLDCLPLGPPFAQALGLNVGRVRVGLIGMSALLTAAGTLIVGPFAFIGLMAPHLARLAGGRRAIWHLPLAAAFGSLILVGADFLGRNLLFPYQLPAGTMTTFLGMPVFIWLLLR